MQAGTAAAGQFRHDSTPSQSDLLRLTSWRWVKRFRVWGSKHVGNDQFGFHSLDTHIDAQELPNEHVSNRNDADETTLSPSSSQTIDERFKGPFGPPPVVVTTNIHQMSNGWHSILLRQHPEDGGTMSLIVHEQNPDCPGNVPH